MPGLPQVMPIEGGPSSQGMSNLDLNIMNENLKSQYYSACDSYQEVLREIRVKHDPAFDPEGQSGVVSIADIRRMLPNDKTAAVQFSITDAGCYAIIIYSEGMDAIKLTGANGERLTAMSQEWSDCMQEYRNSQDVEEWQQGVERILDKVSGLVIQPLVDRLRVGISQLILVPHRELHVFPLSACLIGNSERLCDRFEIWMAPSLSVLHECVKREYEHQNQVFCLELPGQSLESHQIEMNRLEHHFERQVIRHPLTAEPLEDLEIAVSTADIWHYSGHCRFDSNDPLGSFLGESRTSPSLSLRDLFVTLRLPHTRLAVLSACESGMLNPDILDDHVGFPAALLRAGAKCVISSYWVAEDLPTMLLFDRFYQNWKNGSTISGVFRDAQLWLRGTPDRSGEALNSGDALMGYLRTDTFMGSFSDPKDYERCIEDAGHWANGDAPPFESPVYWAAFSVSGDCGQTWHDQNTPVETQHVEIESTR